MNVDSIHDELANASGQQPAGYIRTDVFGRFTLDRFQKAVKRFKGLPIEAGTRQFSAALRDAIIAPGTTVSLVQPVAPTSGSSFPGTCLDLKVSSSIDVLVDLFITGDPGKVISTVTMTFKDVRIHLQAEDNAVVLDGVDSTVTRSYARAVNADQLIVNAGLDPLEASRVEGHIAYGVVSQAVTSELGRRTEISLAEVFPGINFGSALRLAILDGGSAIGVVPTGVVTQTPGSTCSCKAGPNFDVQSGSATQTNPPNVGPGTTFGNITIGGPIADNLDPLKDFGIRVAHLAGNAGLYMPLEFASQTFKVMPAVEVVAEDQSGTIGYRASATIGFSKPAVSVDIAGGGLLLDIDLDVSVQAYCDMDVFKGLRLPIGWAIISPAAGSNAHIQIGVYPAIDNSGTLRLRSTLKSIDSGKYVAVVIGIGTALEILGVTAWIGFLVDTVLSIILSTGLPIALKRALSDYLGGMEWTLINALPVVDRTRLLRFRSPFDARPASILISADVDS